MLCEFVSPVLRLVEFRWRLMAISGVVFGLVDKELLDLFKQLRVKVMGEMKTGRRISSVSVDGQSVTYDLEGVPPAVA